MKTFVSKFLLNVNTPEGFQRWFYEGSDLDRTSNPEMQQEETLISEAINRSHDCNKGKETNQRSPETHVYATRHHQETRKKVQSVAFRKKWNSRMEIEFEAVKLISDYFLSCRLGKLYKC